MPFAPDLNAVLGVMALRNVKDPNGCLDKVVAAFSHFLNKAK